MNTEEIIRYITEPAFQIAMVTCLTEIVKTLGINKKYLPLFDLFFGITSGIFITGYMLGHGILQGAAVGVVLGLAACGMFSGAKNVLEARSDDGEGN